MLYGIISLTTMLSGLGLTFQMALLSDMIGLVSLHAFCFYVYAARLYGLTLHGLRSTLRMFRGRKWNPLHHRVDVGHFSLDQLGVGMFIASSLLFFLPTILVFYIVFLSVILPVPVQKLFIQLCFLLHHPGWLYQDFILLDEVR